MKNPPSTSFTDYTKISFRFFHMNISLDSTKEEKLKTKSNVKDCESEKTIYERVFNGCGAAWKMIVIALEKPDHSVRRISRNVLRGRAVFKKQFSYQWYHSSRYVVVKNQSTEKVVERQSSEFCVGKCQMVVKLSSRLIGSRQNFSALTFTPCRASSDSK